MLKVVEVTKIVNLLPEIELRWCISPASRLQTLACHWILNSFSIHPDFIFQGEVEHWGPKSKAGFAIPDEMRLDPIKVIPTVLQGLAFQEAYHRRYV